MAVDYLELAKNLWVRTKGRAWEPPEPNNPHILAMIERGYLRRVDARFGFERMKDSAVAFTETAKNLFINVPV